MTSLQTHQDICWQFSKLLSYPSENLLETTAACQGLRQLLRPDAAEELAIFAEFLASNDRAQLEELFTSTFELQPTCHPYIGYQLCGESQQRTMFLMKLNEIYRQHDFQSGIELPDHISEMLRFVGIIDDQGCRQELLNEGLAPALEKLIPGIENDEHPYKGVLKALHRFLTEDATAAQSSPEKGALS